MTEPRTTRLGTSVGMSVSSNPQRVAGAHVPTYARPAPTGAEAPSGRRRREASDPRSTSDWDRMHMTLAAWKARSLLAEAIGHLRDAIPAGEDHDPEFEAEFRAAIEATEATIERLRAITASGQ